MTDLASPTDEVPRHAEESRRAAEQAFGWSQLYDDQLNAMTALMDGRDVLAVLPTGTGKSAIYQVPALLLDGPTLVVSPLLALQHDQQESIEESRAPEAVAVNSAQRTAGNRRAWSAVREGPPSISSSHRNNLRRTRWSTSSRTVHRRLGQAAVGH